MILAAACSLVAVYQLYIVDFDPAEIAVCIIPIFGFAVIGYHIVGPNLPAETESHGWLHTRGVASSNNKLLSRQPRFDVHCGAKYIEV
jgi:hypothetical protein